MREKESKHHFPSSVLLPPFCGEKKCILNTSQIQPSECKVITKKKKLNESSSSRSNSSSSSIRSTFFRQKNLYDVRDTRARIDIFYIRGNIVGKRAVWLSR